MARTAASKINSADAQEWLESLQQVGEGWYRQVALAVRAGAHKALGMERREFAQAIGQRMIDPRQAIIELHKEGHSMAAIADVLGVSQDRTVLRVLAEEGLVEWGPGAKRRALESGRLVEGEVIDEEDDGNLADRLEAENDRLRMAIKGEEAKRKREVDAIKEKMNALRHDITEEKKRMRQEAEAKLTEAERERAKKEADAWAEEQAGKVVSGLAFLVVDHIVGALEEAAAETKLLIDQGAVTSAAIEKIEAAHAGFVDELNVARMAASVG